MKTPFAPWYHRSWIFPRDPGFAVKANRILDLYERSWKGQPLKSDEFVISADEKTSIQAPRRKHPTLPAAPQRPMRVEDEYHRCGAWAYIAALDVHHARVFGRCETTTGIAPFDRLVEQVMTRPPYNDARHVFWIVDNGSSHRGKTSVARLKQQFPRLTLVHGPVHARWLNQVEIYFSIVQRKVLTRTTSPVSTNWRSACLTSNTTGNQRQNRSNGSSPKPPLRRSSPNSRPMKRSRLKRTENTLANF